MGAAVSGAAVLGAAVSGAAVSGAAISGALSSPLAGWIPHRASLVREPAEVVRPGEVLRPAVVPAVVVAPAAPSAGAFWSSAGRAPAGLAPAPSDNGRHRRPGPPKPAILTLPVALRGVRARPRRLAVLGILIVLVVVATVFGVRVAWARSSAKPAPIAAAAHGPPNGLVARTVPAAFATSGTAGSPTATGGVLVIHVVGQVRRPGVVRLPSGSRVLDAVSAAGGAMPSADLNHLNLARVLADGEQIVVPKPGENVPVASGPQGAGAAGPGSGGGSAGALVDLNTADLAALDSLPGVGPVLSQRILDWRTAHGRFSSVDELGEVSGIGVKLLAQIGPKVRV